MLIYALPCFHYALLYFHLLLQWNFKEQYLFALFVCHKLIKAQCWNSKGIPEIPQRKCVQTASFALQ